MLDISLRSKMMILSIALLLIVAESTALSAIATSTEQTPLIKHIQKSSKMKVQINGSNFGSKCLKCEVVVQYLSGYSYAHAVVYWNDSKIIIKLPDIAKGLNMSMSVGTLQGQSNKMKFRLEPYQAYKQVHNRVLKAQSKGTVLYERLHNDPLGGKGIDQFKVSNKLPSCGQSALVFDYAKIIYKENRFAKAKFSQMPKPGCTQCSPISISWINEPTGKLDYQLQVYQREISGICPDKVRR